MVFVVSPSRQVLTVLVGLLRCASLTTVKTDVRNFQFRESTQPTVTDNGTFAGVGYTGGLIDRHGYWGNLIFDLDSMSVSAPLPVLLDHDPEKRAGVADKVDVSASGLQVGGRLLSNAHGQSVRADGVDGYPWQMSVYIRPNVIEEHYSPVMVNGQLISASRDNPLTVFRDSKIKEVSFVSLGSDDKTTANIFSDQNTFTFTKTIIAGDVMTPEEVKADRDRLQSELEAMKQKFADTSTALQAAQKQLEDAQAAKRQADINQLFADIGTKPTADELKQFSELPDATYQFMASQLRKSAKDAGKQGLTEDYQFKDKGSAGGDLGAFDAAFNERYGSGK